MVHNLSRSSEQAVRDLRARMRGRIIARGDEGYENVRKVWNGAVDHHPAAIAFCTSPEDVQAALRVGT